MKLRTYLVVLAVMLRSAVGLCQGAPLKPCVRTNVPWVVTVGESFQVRVALEPPPRTPVEVQMETGNITYSENRFRLGRGKKLLKAKVVHTRTGLAQIHAIAEGYEDDYNWVNVGYRGRFKLSNSEKLPYERATTLSLQIVDSDGKPLPTECGQILLIETSDAVLSSATEEGNKLELNIGEGATMSPQIRIKPRSRIGGIVQLNTALMLGGGVVFSQESFALVAQPAWWLPLVLAIVGGVLHAVYKISRLPSSTFWGAVGILMTSAVAGCVGYLVANFDLFGLKLDPNVLRTYPLIGFLFSYFGIEVLLSDKLSSPKPPTAPTPPAPY